MEDKGQLDIFFDNIQSSGLNLFDWMDYLRYEDLFILEKLKEKGIPYFYEEKSFIDYLVPLITNQYLHLDTLVSRNFFSEDALVEIEGGCINLFRLPHISFEKVGISDFAIIYDSYIMVISYTNMPIYEKHSFDIMLWNLCIERVVVELRKHSLYKFEIVAVNGVKSIMASVEIGQINNESHIKLYFLYKQRSQSNFLNLIVGNLLQKDISIPAGLLNVDINTLPRSIELSVRLGWWNSRGFFKNEILGHGLVFQVIRNIDNSLTLKPDPISLRIVLNQQIKLLEMHHNIHYRFNYHDDDYWLVPSQCYKLFKYIRDNSIETDTLGKVKEVYTLKQSLEIAKQLEEETRNEWVYADDGTVICSPECTFRHDEFFENNETIIITTE